MWHFQTVLLRVNAQCSSRRRLTLATKTDTCHQDLPGLLIAYHVLCWLFCLWIRIYVKSACMENFPFSTSQWKGFPSFFKWLGTILCQSILASWNNQNLFKNNKLAWNFICLLVEFADSDCLFIAFITFFLYFSNKIYICNISIGTWSSLFTKRICTRWRTSIH